jgi:hypothetical protein
MTIIDDVRKQCEELTEKDIAMTEACDKSMLEFQRIIQELKTKKEAQNDNTN